MMALMVFIAFALRVANFWQLMHSITFLRAWNRSLTSVSILRSLMTFLTYVVLMRCPRVIQVLFSYKPFPFLIESNSFWHYSLFFLLLFICFWLKAYYLAKVKARLSPKPKQLDEYWQQNCLISSWKVQSYSLFKNLEDILHSRQQ